MTENLKPTRVKLLKWEKTSSSDLSLYFEKVPSYTSSRDFTKKGFPVTVYSDFGSLNLTLSGVKDDNDFVWLDQYINDSNVFLVEENSNEISFMEGTDPDGSDWDENYSPIEFDSKKIEHLPLSEEEWKEKYVKMTLNWEKMSRERHDILQLDFLNQFIRTSKAKLDASMPESPSEELVKFKTSLENGFRSWVSRLEDHKKEMEKIHSDPDNKALPEEDAQKKVNSSLKGFWQKLSDSFKSKGK